MKTFEKLGVFYLGKVLDPQSGDVTPEYLLYDSKDLVTHAVCVGMTGSGKTGMCITLLEEAAIDGIPAIIVDPKGDLGDLLLAFPHLSPEEFRPWINEEEARKKGKSPAEFAGNEAERWRKGLESWEQDEERIQRLRASADFAIYTPGSTAGLPVSITSSFAAPPQQYFADAELLKDRISTTASSLLGLLGIQADPLRSREHILIAKILEQEWMSGRDLDLAGLIRMIQSPPLERVGVFDLESFYPSADRLGLAMMLNNLLAAPGFGIWLEGEPLDIGAMLHTGQGKPRMSIFSIAHLSDAERMFFVTILLNQVMSWMRSQAGTTSLRAILYMDEIFGYFPPVAEPPSKRPLLTMLKQARAYGLGIVLATQNPVDLDYKGLANTGTWFIGRLQTERDRERLLDGLTGAADGSGAGMDRAKTAELLAGLKQRAFLMQNAHEDRPVLFTTRWALSYLSGPLTRGQIKQLMQDRKPETAAAPQIPAAPPPAPAPQTHSAPPQLAADIRQFYVPLQSRPAAEGRLVYRPFLYGSARFQVVNNTYGVTFSQTLGHRLEMEPNMTAAPWNQASPMDLGVEEFSRQPVEDAGFEPVPTTILESKRLQGAQKGYVEFIYRDSQLVLWKSKVHKVISQPGETERDFRVRLQQMARERRDFEVDRLRQRYAGKTRGLEQSLMKARQRIEREQEQYGQQKVQTAISVGATILGALMGRKAISTGTLGRATTAGRQASRMSREREDVERAREDETRLQQQLAELEAELQKETDRIAESFDPLNEDLQQIVVRPTKADILLQNFGILWMPYELDPAGSAKPLA